MLRIAGVIIPAQKHIEIGLTHIYGIGRSRARQICGKLGIDCSTKVKDLPESDLEAIRQAVDGYEVEGDLRRRVMQAIKRLKDLGCYRGLRHRRGLPVRGQQTKTNARTRKGPPKPIRK